jgi:hypothetical protein
MPGKSLVVLDPALMLAVDVFPCEDGHAQERSLLASVLPSVEAGDVWIADRNFCTYKIFGWGLGRLPPHSGGQKTCGKILAYCTHST